jgi:hypothetical protein
VLAEFALPLDRQETRADLYQIFESLTHEAILESAPVRFTLGNSSPKGLPWLAPIPLRPEFDAALRRRLARQWRDTGRTGRGLARAEICAGGLRTETFARDFQVAAL